MLSKTDNSDKESVKLLGLDKETINRYRSMIKEIAPQKPTPDNPLGVLDTRSHLAKVVTTMFASRSPEDPIPVSSRREGSPELS